MARFILRVGLYAVATGIMFLMIALFAGPFTDPFYQRFTTPLQRSLVVGTSRAAQGVIPQVMNEELLNHDIDAGLYNYSFTIKSSPYGRPYLESVMRKLDVDKSRDHYFVVTVDPWSISTLFYSNNTFEEESFAPSNMTRVDMNPNTEYVYKNVDNRPLMILRSFRHVNHPEVMGDGSLKVSATKSREDAEETTIDRLKEYKRFSARHTISATRMSWLNQMLDSLSAYGPCVVVRIPVHPDMRKLEDATFPEFDSLMTSIATDHDLPYLNYKHLADSLNTTDGNHLDRVSAISFSKKLARDLTPYFKLKD